MNRAEAGKEKGVRSMKEITLEATLNNLDKVNAFIEEQLDEAGCPMKISMQVCVAVEELFVNVASYAYGDGTGDVTVRFPCEDGTVSVSFIDSGAAFDPTRREDPDTSLPASERQIGGLGIFMVKKSMDTLGYEYKDNQNIVTITKKMS